MAETVSVVIPAYNAAQTLPQTLAALNAAQPPPLEVIVVDDGSTDATMRLANDARARVIRLEKNVGAAAAKNRGAQTARGAILFFTDADIVPPRNAIGLIQNALRDAQTDGVVGLLDENIPHANWASQFKNLWMNFTYARFADAPRIGLFYTSIAAMRRTKFLELDGFDENYRGASIAEDTEFGQRAWGRGARIRLEPPLRVTHLKRYSVASVLREDFKRAYALTLMRLRKRGEPFYERAVVLSTRRADDLSRVVVRARRVAVTKQLAWSGRAGVVFYFFCAQHVAAAISRAQTRRGLCAARGAFFAVGRIHRRTWDAARRVRFCARRTLLRV